MNTESSSSLTPTSPVISLWSGALNDSFSTARLARQSAREHPWHRPPGGIESAGYPAWPGRRISIRFMWPLASGLDVANITRISSSSTKPVAEAASSILLSRTSSDSAGGTTTGYTPQTSAKRRAMTSSWVTATIGAIGLWLEVNRAEYPV